MPVDAFSGQGARDISGNVWRELLVLKVLDIAKESQGKAVAGKSDLSAPNTRVWFVRVGACFVIAAAPMLLFPRSFLPWVGIGLVAIGWLLQGIGIRRLVARTPLNKPIAVILIMTLVSLYPSVDITLSLPKLYGIVLSISLFYAVANNVRSWRYFWFGFGFLVASIFMISLLGLVGTEWISGKYPIMRSIYTMLPRLITDVQSSIGPRLGFHPNELGGTLAFLLPLPMALVISKTLARRYRNLMGIIIVVGLGVLVLSASRSSAVSMILSGLILLVWRWRRAGLAFMTVSAIGVVIVASVNSPAVIDFLFRVDTASVATGLESLPSRLEVWSRARYMIEDFPFTGIGLNTFSYVLNKLYPMFTVGPDAVIPHAHNIFLQTAVDLGLGGLMGFLGLWSCAALAGWRTHKQIKEMDDNPGNETMAGSDSTMVRAAMVGLVVGLVAYLTYGLTDAITLGAKPTILLWMMMGLVVAAQRMIPALPARPEEDERRGSVSAPRDKILRGPRKSISFLWGSVIESYWVINYLLVVLALVVVGIMVSGWTP